MSLTDKIDYSPIFLWFHSECIGVMMVEEVKPLRGYDDSPIYYVYFHKRKDGSVFYVGKGKENRAWVKKDRNNHWKNVVNKNGGFDVEIVAKDLKEQDAFKLEAEWVNKFGMDNLTNQTLGGISTTGFRHSEETRELQSEIAQERIRQNPELVLELNKRLDELHYKQRYDIDYKKRLSEAYKQSYKNLTEEEKIKRAEARCLWQKDTTKKAAATAKALATKSNTDLNERLSVRMKNRWANFTEEERKIASERSTSVIMREDVRAKLLEIRCDKIVVNKKFVFDSKRLFLDHIGSEHAPLLKAFASAKKQGYNFCVTLGYFVEDFDKELHCNLPKWNGETLKKLDFTCLPRSKAVVMDESVVFLSMMEAAVYCNGKTVDATADFITKNMKRNKPAMGHNWRIASVDEVQTEILKRVKELE